MVEDLVAKGQKVYRKLKHAPFPVVAAPSGMALGGGCEICLNADAVQAHAETYIGLVEVGVGVIPAWGGCDRAADPLGAEPSEPGRADAAARRRPSRPSAWPRSRSRPFEAKELLFLREADGITMNRDRLLADAKAKALALVEGYQAARDGRDLPCPGRAGGSRSRWRSMRFRLKGVATPHDEVVAEQLADGALGRRARDITRAGRRGRICWSSSARPS